MVLQQKSVSEEVHNQSGSRLTGERKGRMRMLDAERRRERLNTAKTYETDAFGSDTSGEGITPTPRLTLVL